MTFKDYFSKQAKEYAKFRPTYPPEIFEFLARTAPVRRLAWDCATGSGQAAQGLSAHFDHVVATDASGEQILHAEKNPGVTYQVASAEDSGLPAHEFDLVAAATAAHWFDLDRFYAEAKRVLKPGGILAIWSYGASEDVSQPAIAEVLKRYSKEIVGPYFAPELHKLWNGYSNLKFPFEEIETPEFFIRVEWNLEQVMGYLLSWSATQSYVEAQGSDPRELIRADLENAWGPPENRITRAWKIDMRVGRFSG